MVDNGKQPTREMTPSEMERQRRVREISFWKMVILFPMSILLRIWIRTLRISIPPEAIEEIKRPNRRPIIVAFWHNRLIVGAALHQRLKKWIKMNGLVSPSSDGAWLAAFFKLIGIGTVRGSTSRRGGQAIIEIHRRMKRGEDIAITPDGPRGPKYKFNPGAALLAQITHCTVALVPAKFSWAIHLKSWDGFIIPLPFSKIEVVPQFFAYDKIWDHIPAKSLAENFENKLRDATED